MSQNNSNDKLANLVLIEKINQVDGFDPTPFAVDYTDLTTGEVRKRLPVMIQMAWFRMKYPEGKIAVSVTPGKDCFVATARVYPSFKDPAESYLAEATASRGYLAEKPSVSPREWAQTAAVGIALRNAGFGLQFALAGEDFEAVAPNEFGVQVPSDSEKDANVAIPSVSETAPMPVQESVELTPEQKLEQAMNLPCPIAKYAGKTLGDMITQDPNSLIWIATKYKGSEETSAAAKLICEYAQQQATA